MSTLVLTFDIDWAHDAVIADTLSIVAKYNIKATWFATHKTSMLDDIINTAGQEIGLHPNFNPLMLNSSREDAESIFARLKSLVPDAKSVRSHSLLQSSRLRVMFKSSGITHESNYVLPPHVGGQLMPWRDFAGLIQVPIRWEDDLRLLDSTMGEPVSHLDTVTPLTVDFHPIHVFLNTLDIADYESARVDFQDPAALLSRRRPPDSGGSRDRLIALLKGAAARQDFGRCLSALSAVHGDKKCV